MAEAIRDKEGFYPGSRAWRNNNPGNLKFADQREATGYDNKHFARFRTMQDGWNALIRQIELVATNRSKAYPKDCTMLQFFQTYAPDNDGNNSHAYAEEVCATLGVNLETKLLELL